MEKIGLHIRSIGLKALVIGSCLILLTGNAAFANTADVTPRPDIHYVAGAGSMAPDMLETQMYDGYPGEVLKEKHHEIVHYVFEQQQGNSSVQGFTVTHTVPSNGKIEIGISPYDDVKAKYVYDIFGDELVRVVEGIQPLDISAPSAGEQMGGDNSNQSSASAIEPYFGVNKPGSEPFTSSKAEYVDVVNGDYYTNMPEIQSSRMVVPEDNHTKIDRTVISNAGVPTNAIAGDSMITTMNGGTSEAAVLAVALHEPIHSTHSSNLLFAASILVIVILLGGTAFIVRRVRNAHKEA